MYVSSKKMYMVIEGHLLVMFHKYEKKSQDNANSIYSGGQVLRFHYYVDMCYYYHFEKKKSQYFHLVDSVSRP